MPSQPRAAASGLPRVAIVDADRRVQQSVAEVLRLTGEIDVVGTAGDVRAALELVARTTPEVVLVDLRLPDPDAGAALVSAIARGWPATRIVTTGWGDGGSRADASMRYVSKGSSPEQFVEAVIDACGPLGRVNRELGAADQDRLGDRRSGDRRV